MKHIIMTVGTSLLTNNGWRHGSVLPEEKEAKEWAVSSAKPSAEVSTWNDIDQDEVAHVTLVATDTEDGKLCAAALTTVIPGDVVTCPGLTMSGKVDDYEKGLTQFADILMKGIQDARRKGHDPVLVITAGTKGQTATAFLVGVLEKAPCIYRHERLEANATLPGLPLTWSDSFFRQTKRFWEHLDTPDSLTYPEVEELLKRYDEPTKESLRQLLTQVTVEGETYCDLSTVGYVLLRHFWGKEEEASVGKILVLSSKAREQRELARKNGREFGIIEQKLARVASYAGESDPPFEHKKGDLTDLLMYPGGGRKANSHVSLFLDDDGTHHICEFYFSHDDRDAALRQGKVQRKNYGGFEPVTL